MKNALIIVLFLSRALFCAEYPYDVLNSSYRDNGSALEISPTTPFKSQDGIGLCYGFSATSLLEHYRCLELNLNCSDPKEFISTLDVTSYYRLQSLREGGDTFRLLDNIARSRRLLAREECVKFQALVHQMADNRNQMIKDEKRGWIFLTKKWNEYRGIGQNTQRVDCVSCLADAIKATLVNVVTPKDQIQNAFTTANNLEEFLYKALLPAQCLEEKNTLAVPAFNVKTFPGYKDTLTADSLSDKISNVLSAGIPLEMSICGTTNFDGTCAPDSGHSIALFGLKEVCNNQTMDCRKMVKVKNSYGASWQQQNNDGWVDLKALAESSLLMGASHNITWIERPGFVLPKKVSTPKTPTPSVRPRPGPSAGIPNEYKNYNGIWKCPGAKFVDRYEPGCVPLK